MNFWPFSKCQSWTSSCKSQICVCKNGGSGDVDCMEFALGKDHGCTLSMYTAGCSEQWSPSICFSFLVLIHMEFLAAETVSSTLSLEQFEQVKPPLHSTTFLLWQGKALTKWAEEKLSASWCPDWAVIRISATCHFSPGFSWNHRGIELLF